MTITSLSGKSNLCGSSIRSLKSRTSTGFMLEVSEPSSEFEINHDLTKTPMVILTDVNGVRCRALLSYSKGKILVKTSTGSPFQGTVEVRI